jgi:hypothetical protein
VVIEALIAVLAAFLVGTAAAMAALPGLAPTPVGRFCFRMTVSLLGAAAAIAVATLWSMIRTMDLVSSAGQTLSGAPSSGDALLSGLSDLALRCGVVAALATIVYVLGPADSRR